MVGHAWPLYFPTPCLPLQRLLPGKIRKKKQTQNCKHGIGDVPWRCSPSFMELSVPWWCTTRECLRREGASSAVVPWWCSRASCWGSSWNSTSFRAQSIPKVTRKIPNVASETLAKKLAAFGVAFLSLFSLLLASLSCRFAAFNLATLQRATALRMGTTRNAETPPNFAPKTSQKWPENSLTSLLKP